MRLDAPRGAFTLLIGLCFAVLHCFLVPLLYRRMLTLHAQLPLLSLSIFHVPFHNGRGR